MKLPSSTIVNKFIPKEKFYNKTNINNRLRQQFIDEIEKIRWTNKISPDTLNITCNNYSELQIFEITLKQSELSIEILNHIDAFIPYPILFILKRPHAIKAIISFKEHQPKNENQMKVDSYYETLWQQDLDIDIKGRSVDEIYKNFLFQITPKLNEPNETNIKAAIEVNKEHEKIQKQIDIINRRIANEPSVAKKQELARKRSVLERQL